MNHANPLRSRLPQSITGSDTFSRMAESHPLPLQALFDAAADQDRGNVDMSGCIGAIRDAGRLGWGEQSPDAIFADLVSIAEANLPVARLYEGHVNALRLIRTFGGESLKTAVQRDADAGLLFGVWGAEGAQPLAIDDAVLTGGKRFTSGLGTVAKAIVTIGEGKAVRLGLLDVSDPARHHPETWHKTGMRATLSGDFDASGLPESALHWIGAPGEYLEEPGFIGGVWRIAAVQVGGTLGLLRAAVDHLSGLGRLTAEAQVARLAPLLTRALAAAQFTRHAAACAEGPRGRGDPERAASLSAQARLLTEEVGQDAIAGVERAIGLPHFNADATTGRIARDLATYLRQAARDALLQRAGTWALGQQGPFSRLVGEDDDHARA